MIYTTNKGGTGKPLSQRVWVVRFQESPMCTPDGVSIAVTNLWDIHTSGVRENPLCFRRKTTNDCRTDTSVLCLFSAAVHSWPVSWVWFVQVPTTRLLVYSSQSTTYLNLHVNLPVTFLPFDYLRVRKILSYPFDTLTPVYLPSRSTPVVLVWPSLPLLRWVPLPSGQTLTSYRWILFPLLYKFSCKKTHKFFISRSRIYPISTPLLCFLRKVVPRRCAGRVSIQDLFYVSIFNLKLRLKDCSPKIRLDPLFFTAL